MNDAPLVVDIKRNSLDDGPGIRSVVFFKGCTLSCIWCHNPECLSDAPELSFDPSLCVGSRACVSECPSDALLFDGGLQIDRDACARHFQCVEACPSRALSRVGEHYEVEELATHLLRDRPFFWNSGGGVTLSGGEPTRYIDYVSELAERLHKARVHVLLQTCGTFGLRGFEEKLYPHLDEIYFDLKLFSTEAHQEYCGAPNDKILENFTRLNQLQADGGVPILPRVPLVPGVTTERENLTSLASFLAAEGASRVGIVRYNPLWPSKAAKLGGQVAPEVAEATWMRRADYEQCVAVFKDAGLEIG